MRLNAYGDVNRKKLSKSEGALYDAVKDPDKHATIETVSGDDTVNFGRNISAGYNKVDVADLKQLDTSANKGGLTSYIDAAHETVEAYLTLGESLRQAHYEASDVGFPGLEGPIQNRVDKFDGSGNLVQQTGDYHIVGSQGIFERITITINTPIPRASVPKNGGIIESSEPVKIVNVKVARELKP